MANPQAVLWAVGTNEIVDSHAAGIAIYCLASFSPLWLELPDDSKLVHYYCHVFDVPPMTRSRRRWLQRCLRRIENDDSNHQYDCRISSHHFWHTGHLRLEIRRRRR